MTEKNLKSIDEEVYVLPTSFAQQRLWFLDQFEPNSPFYNIPTAVRFKGNLNVPVLEKCINEIIRRHETLRTTFDTVEGKPCQIVHPYKPRKILTIDVSGLTRDDRERETFRLAGEEARTPFDLRRGPLLRATLIKVGEREHVVLITMHHIISDGWSMGVFVREIAALYDAFSHGRSSPLPELEIQYGDFAAWQEEYIAGEVLENQLGYWKKQLGGDLPVLEIPADRPRPTVQTAHGDNEDIVIPGEIANAIRNMARREGATLFMALTAAFQTLLYRYTGLEDVLVGSPIANRNRAEIESLIGFFVNTLVLRTDLSGNPTFRELLQRVKKVTLEAYDNQDVPFERLVEVLQPNRDMSHSPLFQVMFILQNAPMKVDVEISDVALSSLNVNAGTSTYDLTLMVTEQADGFSVSAEYNTDLYDASTIQRLLFHFQNLLAAVARHPDHKLSSFPILTEEEKSKLLVEWNDCSRDFPESVVIHQLFEDQVVRTPDAVAVVFDDEYLTFGELNRRANKLARHLVGFGVGPDIKVSICIDKGLDLPIAVLGTLKAGGAYVPVDPTYPKDRIAYMIGDSNASVVLTNKELHSTLSFGNVPVVLLDEDWPVIDKLGDENPASYPDSDNLAYMIYTSGSTGKSKGTMVSHKSIVNAYLAWEKDYRLRSDVNSHLQMASFSFDVFGGDFVRALCSGGKLVLCPRDFLLDAEKLYRLMVQEKVNCAEFVPAVLRNLIQYLDESGQRLDFMRALIAGSDVWYVKEYKKFLNYCGPETRLINSFGLTEAAVDSTFFEGNVENYPDERLVPIGRPFANSKIYIVDKNLNITPVGIPGELCVAGPNLARGYYKRPDLTAEKFIPNPFSDVPGARLYRTGDLARFLSDGNIEFLGRIDHQIKIRGFRIELGEIETVLEKYSEIRNAVILAREDKPGDKRLVAYVVAKNEHEPDIADVRSFLKEQLPDYMLPSAIVVLDSLPLTPNGKVDRKALPAPEQKDFEALQKYVAPQTETEQKLAAIWGDILGLEKVGIEDNFFELGGHSLLATQVISRIRDTFHIDLPLRNLFEYVKIVDLAHAIDKAAGEEAIPPITPMPEDVAPVLSFAQERLWFLDQLEPNSPFYNIPEAVRIRGPLDIFRLEACFNEIIRRHESLRTNFREENGRPVLVISPEAQVDIHIDDLRSLPNPEREIEALRIAQLEAQRPFDLARGSLFRVHVLHIDHEDYMLLLTIHHIISDDWSTQVLVGELVTLYEAFSRNVPSPLPELPIQYSDFAWWQRNWLRDEVLEEQLNYWKTKLAGSSPVLELPTDRPRPAMQTANGSYKTFRLSKETTKKLYELSQREGATIFMTLLAAFNVLLYRYSGQDDINIGTPIANRNRGELESLIGFFVNTLVLRSDLSGNPSFCEFLKRVRETALGAYAHQDLPFEKIVDALNVQRDMSHSPLFQVMFALQNTPSQVSPVESEIRISPVEAHSGTAKFDLTLFMLEEGETMSGAVEFNTDLFDEITIVRMMNHFKKIVEGIVSDPQQQIAAIPMVTKKELEKVLVDWNGKRVTPLIQKNIKQIFEEQAVQVPNNIALQFEQDRMTYFELNRRANLLAHRIIKAGVGPDVLVGICIERSVEMIVAILAVLKAGGAYVPLDPGYPEERLSYILHDSNVPVLLTKQNIFETLPESEALIICVDTEWEEIEHFDETNPKVDLVPENLAYMIYTSGSTGKPKGTLITHRGLSNYLDWTYRAYPLHEGRGSLVHSTIAFDATVTAVFTPILTGKTITLVADDADLEALGLALRLYRDFNVVKITPAHLELLSRQIPPEEAAVLARAFVIGGENLTSDQIAFWQKNAPDVLLFNEYGPTETVVGCVVFEALKWRGTGSVPIGKTIPNMRVYVLDEHLQPVPAGVPGELYIAGEGVARGYHNRPDLTGERFLPDPFSESSGARMYKTGDLVRYLNDGNLIFLGRVDNQVKIRGYRIELGEIESVLQQMEGVENVVTIVREDTPGDKRLVAYFTTGNEAALSVDDLRIFIKDQLPDYMVPAAFVKLDAFPLTANGKIDRKALPKPDYTALQVETEFVAPRTGEEKLLAGLWQDILNLEKVGIHDNFFELGGHSLLATQVISRIRDTFEVELPLRALFEAPTIASLLIHIEKARMQADGSAAPPLKRIPRDGELPLSFSQQRLWFLDQLAPDNPFYNIPAAIRLTGSLDIAALENSINEIIRRHEVLRTIFKDERGRPVAVIQPQLKIKLEITDLTHLQGDEQEKETLRLVTKDAMQPFKLDQGPLFRTGLIKTGENEYVILFTMHHIVSDGWSTGVLMREVGMLYEAFSRGAGSPLPELPIQYADYAAWQRNWLKDEVLEQQLQYWKKTIGVNPPILDLPTDHPRPPMQTFNGAFVSTELPIDVSQGLNYLSQKHGATLFMTLLAAFQTLLHHYTHQNEILVGSPIANRTHSETEALIGFFVNTLVLKADFSDDLTFIDLLEQIRKMTLGGYAHQDLPFERLVDELQPDRDMSHSPLFQAMFVLQNTPRASQSMQLPSLKMQVIEADERTAKFDITLVMAEAEEGLMAELEYNTDLFDHETIARMLDHFRLLLQRIVNKPHLHISEFSLISDEERAHILQDFNKTEIPFPADKCIHELFENRVAETPDAPAVVFQDEILTFAQLNERINKLAHYLRGQGVQPEKLVGISVDRSVEMVVGLLGVLKSGGVYVPIDPAYPEERIRYILQDAGIDILLTQDALAEKFLRDEIHKISLDAEWDEIELFSSENPKNLTAPENLAYMIYTSGSTGRPKGTMLQHRGLVNLTLEQIKDFQLDENCRALQFASFSFDASVSEIFTTLISGAALYLAPKEKIMPGPDLTGFLKENKITTITLPPSVLSILGNEGFDDLKTLVSAGEACSKAVAEKWSVNRRFLNAYGPTENTVCASSFHVDEIPDRPFMPIGKPIGNVRLYILDEHEHIVPIGVPGELHIAGVNLARGYYHRPDLTAEKFVPNPYSDVPGDRLYKTGDLARFLPDGNIEFLGRIDHQVKLRGFRIELGEIEQVLVQHEAIHEVVVLVRQLPGRKSSDALLVAYIVEKPDQQVSDDELRAFLHGKLPEYMLPSGFIRLDEIPLTPNGKIDRKALPMPTEKDMRAKTEYVAPRNETEEMLADIWAETLGIERIGIYDNFFESGGHSLLATQLISRIREAFIIDLPISAIFESPFIESMAEKIEELKLSDQGVAAPSIEPVSRDQDLPLSFSQQRLWFLDKLDPGTTTFNLTEAVRLTGALDIAALEKSLLEIVRRHEVLRTTFALKDDGTPVQIIDKEAKFHLEKINLSVFSAEVQEEEVKKLAVAEMEEPFNLNAGPLVRAKLIKLDRDKHVFIITMHHIVSDGWSIGIFIGEIATLYQAFVKGEPSPLPELPVQYADFSYWQRNWLQGEVLEKQIAYWRNQLEGSAPVLELPTDRPRPAMKTFNGSRKYFSINSDLSKSLADLSSKHGVTPFMLMLAAFQTLLYRYSGQDDINVGSPIANRNRLETEKLIGFFVNTLVFRTDLSGNPAFTELLRRVRKMSLGAFAHQDVPFEKLVEVLQPERDLSHTPLFQVMLVFQNAPVGAFQLPDLEMRPIDAENNTIQFDLILTIQEGAQGLDGSFQFNTDLFNESTIERMIAHFKNLLEHVAAHPDQGIAEIPMVTAEEVKKLTCDWNQTESDFYFSYCAHEIFEEQAHKTPDAPALLAEVVDYSALIPLVDESSTVASADFSSEQQLTYHELDVQANRLANYLVSSGVKLEDRVGICLDRSVEMVVSLLAVLKAGAAYVPLDPAYPKERLDYMIKDAGIKVILSNSQLSDKLPLTNADLILLNKEWIPINFLPDTPPRVSVEPENLAYIIYTSGSTGKPKGVLLQHRGLCNLTHAQITDFQVRPDSRVLQFASFSFDASVSEIFMALHSGASLYLAKRETLMSPTKLAQLFRDEKITVVTLPPSMLALLSPEEVPGLETIVSAGEPCSIEMAALWSHGRRFVNAYGPTESTVGVSSYAVESVSPDRKSIPIGRPISNTKLYILDQKLNPVPVGVAGELCISSIGLARGYNNRPDLTAEKFLPNPFSTEPGARMYRTGDLAAFLSDGNIEFLGRIDDQVKVRGFRIELGEIEQVLAQHEAVRDAVVIARNTGGSQTANQLIAYVIRDEDVQISVANLRSYLAAKMPEYMVPNTFMFLDKFPLTPNGKVDRKRLPEPDMTIEVKERHLVPATDELETWLVGLWEDLLQVQPIGITDSFFDFGGHSLMAIQLLTRIKKEYDRDIPLVDFFKDPTVHGLAGLIRESTEQKSEFAASLVKFKDNDTSSPIFLVHPSGGSVHWYTELANALGEEQPVYGIQARGVNGDAEVHTTIEEMAAHNIKAMRLRQKEGPFFISSWSMGVVIVYEMAQQLTAQGEEMGMLAILDQGPILPGDIPDDQTTFLTDMFMGRLKFNTKKLRKLDYNEQLKIVLSRAQKVGLLQKDLSVEQFRNYVHILKVQMDAWRNYKAKPYDGKILLLKSADYKPRKNEPEDLGWGEFVRGGVEIKVVPGNHNTMLWQPNVKVLADHLKTAMEKCMEVK